MEDVLVRNLAIRQVAMGAVLILVVVEDVLVLTDEFLTERHQSVLILVVVEDVLVLLVMSFGSPKPKS